MGWSESGGRCRNHPNHSQSEGVCSSCLTEKLHNLSYFSAVSCSSSATNSPPYSSGSVSPAGRGHHRQSSDVMGSVSLMVSVSSGLKKSRSVACVPRDRVGGGGGKKKKKGGFWSKLLRPAGKSSGHDLAVPAT